MNASTTSEICSWSIRIKSLLDNLADRIAVTIYITVQLYFYTIHTTNYVGKPLLHVDEFNIEIPFSPGPRRF